jgi:hypothetical protein
MRIKKKNQKVLIKRLLEKHKNYKDKILNKLGVDKPQ